MIAASIMLGRALAPVEQAVAQWPHIQYAFGAWHSLSELLERSPAENKQVALPKPAAKLVAKKPICNTAGWNHALYSWCYISGRTRHCNGCNWAIRQR